MPDGFAFAVIASALIGIALYYYVRGEPNNNAHATCARWSMIIGWMVFLALIIPYAKPVGGFAVGVIVAVLLDAFLLEWFRQEREQAWQAKQRRKRFKRRDDAPPL